MILLGMGNFGVWFIMLFNEATMALFLEKFVVSKIMTGFVLGLPGIAVCTIPPIVGYISDKTRSRFGRRKPFIFAGALATFICWLALPQATAYAHVVVVAASIHLCVSFANTPYLALLGDVAPPSQRGAASGYMQFLGSIGGIAYVLIASRIWDNHPDATMYLVGAVFAASMLATAAFIKEPEPPPLEPPKRTGFLEYLKTVTRETEAMKLLLAQMCSIGGFLVIYPFLTLFTVKGLGVSQGDSLYVMMVNTISIMIFVLPLGMLGDRVDRKLLMSILYALCAVFVFFLARRVLGDEIGADPGSDNDPLIVGEPFQGPSVRIGRAEATPQHCGTRNKQPGPRAVGREHSAKEARGFSGSSHHAIYTCGCVKHKLLSINLRTERCP